MNVQPVTATSMVRSARFADHRRDSVSVDEVTTGKNATNAGLASSDFLIARSATVTCLE